MDTRFEVNIKRVSIKGDSRALYLYFDGKLVIKLAYEDLETAITFLISKGRNPELQYRQDLMLDDKTPSSDGM